VDMPKILGLIWTYEHLTVFYMTWSTKGKVWSCSGTWALSGVHWHGCRDSSGPEYIAMNVITM
jgi:hypothetical protein